MHERYYVQKDTAKVKQSCMSCKYLPVVLEYNGEHERGSKSENREYIESI